MKLGVVFISNRHEFLANINANALNLKNRCDATVVLVWNNSTELDKSSVDNVDVIIEFNENLGSTMARNYGALKLQSFEVDYLIFPNDSTTLDTEVLSNIALITRAGKFAVIGSSYRFKNRIFKVPAGPLNMNQLRSVKEASLMISVEAFMKVGMFSSNIGTGSQSLIWSGESLDLLSRVKTSGYEILGFPGVWAKDMRDFKQKKFSVALKYAFGWAVVTRLAFGNLWYVRHIFGPLKTLSLSKYSNNMFISLGIVCSTIFIRLNLILIPRKYVAKYFSRINGKKDVYDGKTLRQ